MNYSTWVRIQLWFLLLVLALLAYTVDASTNEMRERVARVEKILILQGAE